MVCGVSSSRKKVCRVSYHSDGNSRSEVHGGGSSPYRLLSRLPGRARRSTLSRREKGKLNDSS